MTCPSTLTCSQYADGALSVEESARLERHLLGCVSCRESVDGLRAESQALRAAMQAAEEAGVIPAFVPRPTIGRLLTWFGWIALAVWAVNMSWLSLASAAELPGWLGWLAPDALGIGLDLAIAVVSLLARGGADLAGWMLEPARWLALLGLGIGGTWLLLRRPPGRSTSLCLQLGLVAILIGAPAPADAIEIRRDDDRVTVAAQETVDDTLVVFADDVRVEGTVTGDLIAFGENVTVTGTVGGLLVTAGESLNLEGEITGSVLAAGETIDLREGTFLGNLYSAAETITLRESTTVSGNVALAAEEARIEGSVGRDLLTATEEILLAGSVARSVRSYGERFEATGTARVGADLTVTARSEEHVTIAAGATVGGETNLGTWPEEPSKYATFEFYLGQTIRFLAALATGLVLFYLLPALRQTRLDSGADVLTALALGAVALVATPVLALIVIVTLIGAPIGIVAGMVWLVALYLAGIVTAGHVGRMLLDSEEHGHTLPFLVGLLLLSILGIVPFVGGLVRLIATLLGLGLLAQWFRGVWAARAA